MSESALRASGIRRIYRDTMALEVDELSISRGEVLCLLGSSGAGKSTLLRILGLLERPDGGEVLIGGKRADPTNLEARRQVSAAMQNVVMFKGTVGDNVRYGLKVRGVPKRDAAHEVTQALQLLELESLSERRVGGLSGGEAQMVALARSIAVDSKVLLVDEPLAQVDEPLRERLATRLKQHIRDRMVATLWVTHDRAEALALGDRIAVIEDGKLLQTGIPMDVFSRPADERVARLVGTENIQQGVVTANERGLASVKVRDTVFEASSSVSAGNDVLLLVRPEEIAVATSEPQHSSPRNQLRGRVTDAVSQGALTKVYVEAEIPLVAVVTSPTYRDMELRPGTIVWASFKATSVHLIRRT